MADDESMWTRPLFADLTMESTREQVLAAVAESDARDAARGPLTAEDHLYACRRVPPGYKSERDRILERQAAAGEEDQSVPGWDQGA
jgi:hypothetical protein